MQPRQAPIPHAILSSKEICASIPCSSAYAASAFNTVSYTHLDVYKRQAYEAAQKYVELYPDDEAGKKEYTFLSTSI